MSQLDDLLTGARDTIDVKRVYGEPFQSNGITVIPVASVKGGFGSGEGEGGGETPTGRGGGMGISARPIGAYKIQGDEMVWVPAVDVNRVVLLGQVMAIVALLVIRSLLRSRKD